MATAKKLPSGNYRVNLYVGKTPDGKRQYKSFTAGTKKQAEYEAAQYNIENRRYSKSTQNITLAEAYARYISSKENVLSPSTIREYKRSAASSLKSLMNENLENLTQEKIQTAINFEAKNHSAKTVRNIHGLLSAVLSVYLPNFRLHTTLPQKQKPEIYIPSNDDIKKLLSVVKGKEIEKAIMLAAFGSLRRSEVAALTADDIQGNTVTVNKAMVMDENHKWVIKPPKTFSGYRIISLPDFVINCIKCEKGSVVNLSPASITDYFSEALRKAGLKHFRFHDLRHYQASILHAMGVPDKYIIERGGWKTESTLKTIYQHTMDKKRLEVEKDICDYFENMQHKKQHEF